MERTISGYFILIDIKNSVDKKKVDQFQWVQGVDQWIKSFQKVIYNLTADNNNLVLRNFKFLGDSVMAFLQCPDRHPDQKTSKKILEKTYNFSTHTKVQSSIENSNLWRTVICYLHEVVQFEIKGFSSDLGGTQTELIGPEMDMAFRLQKFADTSHIVVNNYFFKSVARELASLKLDPILCHKMIKGWNGSGEEIYALTNVQMIEKTINNNVANPNFMDINVELFQYYVDKMSSALSVG